MKINNFSKIFLCSIMAAGALVGTGLALRNTTSVESSAEGQNVSASYSTDPIFDGEKDMSGKTRWEAKNNDFVRIDDWYYSDLGFSFEYKIKDLSVLPRAEICAGLRSNGIGVTTYFYLTKGKTDVPDSNSKISRVTAVGDGWYRVEVMLNRLTINAHPSPDITVTGHETVDEIYAIWGVQSGDNRFWEDMLVRNMKVIDGFSINQKSITRWDFDLFPYITNWKSNPSHKGIFIEYKNDYKGRIPFKFTLQGEGAAITADMNIHDPTNATFRGRLFETSNGYKRWEILIDDILSPVTGKDNATLYGMEFSWYSATNTQYCFDKVRNSGYIESYSKSVTYMANGQNLGVRAATPKAIELPAPIVENKDFIGWCSDADCTKLWNFNDDVTSDMTLYAKYNDHDFSNPEYSWDGDQCTAYKTCSQCELVITETVTGVYTKDTDATCLTNETGHYVATFEDPDFETQTTAADSVELENTALGHHFGGMITYTWDGAYCTASWSCQREGCDAKQTETVLATYVMDTPATCTTNEKGHLVAIFSLDDFGRADTPTNSFELPDSLAPHTYSAPVYSWDGDTCTAYVVCERCGHVETETKKGTYVKDLEATCGENERGHYVVTFDDVLFGASESSYATVVVADTAKEHTFKAIGGKLYSDLKSGEVTITCVDCGETITLIASSVKATVIPANGNLAAKTTYTMLAFYRGATYMWSVDVPGTPASGNGCGGSIVAASAIITLTSLLGAGLLVFKKRKEDK